MSRVKTCDVVLLQVAIVRVDGEDIKVQTGRPVSVAQDEKKRLERLGLIAKPSCRGETTDAG